jgi:hypothetical protein
MPKEKTEMKAFLMHKYFQSPSAKNKFSLMLFTAVVKSERIRVAIVAEWNSMKENGVPKFFW